MTLRDQTLLSKLELQGIGLLKLVSVSGFLGSKPSPFGFIFSINIALFVSVFSTAQ